MANFIISFINDEVMQPKGMWEIPMADYIKIWDELAKQKSENIDLYEEILQKAKATSAPNHPISQYVKSVCETIDTQKISSNIKGMLEKAQKQKKDDYLVELAKKILSFDETNVFALNALAIYYEKSEDKEEYINVLKRISEIDQSDCASYLELAKLMKEQNKVDNCSLYLRKASARALRTQEMGVLRESLSMLDSLDTQDKSSIFNIFEKALKVLPPQKVESLIHDFHEKHKSDTDLAISILKMLLSVNPKSKIGKEALVANYRIKYKDCPRLEESLSLSSLSSEFTPDIDKSISEFERNIALDKGTFVYHQTWGVGRVVSIDKENVIIDFISKRNHKMSLEMVLKSLQILSKNHIWVLKAFLPAEKIAKRIAKDPQWAVFMLLESGYTTFKSMKNVLYPDVLKIEGWNTFLQAAKKIVKTNEKIGVSSTSSDEYFIRVNPISYEEKLYIKFKSESDFWAKIRFTRSFALDHSADTESEFFSLMIQYFGNKISRTFFNADAVYSHFFLNELSQSVKNKTTEIKNFLKFTTQELVNGIESKLHTEFITQCLDNDIKKAYISSLVKYFADWKTVLQDSFVLSPNAQIISLFKKAGDDSFVPQMIKKSYFQYKHNPDFFFYMVKNYSIQDWQKEGKSEYDLALAQLQIMGLFPKSNVSRSIQQYLIDSDKLYKIIENSDEVSVNNIYDTVNNSIGIDDVVKAKVKFAVSKKYPSMVDNGTSAEESSLLPKGLLCIQKTYEAKKALLADLINVQIPQNAKEISEARELGDLKENSEYQYARDKQKLLNSQMNTLSSELSRAVVVDKKDIDSSKVSFGTKVTVLDKGENKEYVYTVLGPWESQPEKNIISFQSPIGKGLYGLKKDDEVSIEVGDITRILKVLKIELF